MMEKSNNKETINLLDLSDNDSDISDLILSPRKKKVKRKHRPNGTVKVRQENLCGCKRSRTRIVTLWLAGILIVIWLTTLSWLAVVLYGELRRMDVSVKSVFDTYIYHEYNVAQELSRQHKMLSNISIILLTITILFSSAYCIIKKTLLLT